jgi:hypothetical protein
VALNWKSVTAEHVRAALKEVAASKSTDRRSGLVIVDGNRHLPAKDVLRVAYRLANKLPTSAPVKFSSGDGTLNVLVNLGFDARRYGKDVPIPAQE